ncbi:hypothetical protein J6590_050189 [Homalodisca vitripennis]|nr:hypothetical protein J6590_050189 [Homalodisca vitripennis]
MQHYTHQRNSQVDVQVEGRGVLNIACGSHVTTVTARTPGAPGSCPCLRHGTFRRAGAVTVI